MGRAAGILGVFVVMLVAAAPAMAQTATVPAGVSVSGVAIGGLTEAQAKTALRDFFAQPLSLGFGSSTLTVTADKLGARARVDRAVDAALVAAPGASLTLAVSFADWQLRAWIKKRAKMFDRDPVNARARLVGLTPRLSRAESGRMMVRKHARIRLMAAIRAHRRDLIVVPTRILKPALTANKFGPAIVIQRGSKVLTLFRSAGPGAMRVVRRFGIATGMAAYPTPLGSFTIQRMARNPWWYPPKSKWAEGAKPIPPGPGNPLGTRWMGLSIGGVGIHGTPDPASIGYSASHGCIRMRIPEAEWLFERVRLGTPVFIVAS